MAVIARAVTKSFRIEKWLGLNEAPDGDTKLKYGEAVSCRNWRVTTDGNLKRRPGTKTILSLGGVTRALWSGRVAGAAVFLAAGNGKLYKLAKGSTAWTKTEIGSITTTGDVCIFPFDGKAYILTGSEYKVYDGTTLSDVTGYIPIVSVACPPAGGGTTLEQINKLNGKRKVWFSPDGTSTAFVLPEKGLSSVDYVKNRSTGTTYVAGTDYTVDTANGKVTFTAAPATGVSTIEVQYTYPTNYAATVKAMRYAELYNGYRDNRVFLYGDGSNELFYSGIDYDGQSRADYFPDQNEIAVGAANTPVTGAIKHYSRLIVSKPREMYTVSASTSSLADGSVIPVFYLTPVNRSLGNEAMGQAQLVLNSVRTVCDGAIYEWKNNSSYTANLTVDERQAKRLSDRVRKTMLGFNTQSCRCWDDNKAQEYYIVNGSVALVHNYAVDVWYSYYNFPATHFARADGELYTGDADGTIRHVSDDYAGDDGKEIAAYWESGDMDFGTYMRDKYFCELWCSYTPVTDGVFSVTAKSDRTEKTVTVDAGTDSESGTGWDFSDFDFADVSFGDDSITNEVNHLKLLMRRFKFCKLIFQTNKTNARATVSGVSMNVIYGGESR